MFFRKKSVAERVGEDRQLISSNAEKSGDLTLLAKGNADVIAKLKDLQEKLKYMIPLETKTAIDHDKKISAKMDDLKIALTRFDGITTTNIDRIISEIFIDIVGRKD